MTTKRRYTEKPNLWFVGSALACILAALGSYFIGQHAADYILISLAIALLIATAVELRLDVLDRKLDELLSLDHKGD